MNTFGLHMRTSNWMSVLFSVAATVVLFGAVTALAGDAHRGVAPPNSNPYGRTYGEWAAEWWKWVDAIPQGVNPIVDKDGSQCAINQNGPVWFLAGTHGGSATRYCTIPAGKAIFFPLFTYLDDYPCPETPPTPPFQPAPGQSLEDFLIADAKSVVDLVNHLVADLDGRELSNVFSYRAHSKLFSFTAAIDRKVTDSCITGSPQLAVTDGYWLLLEPLSRGEHTLHFLGAINGFTIEATYHLSVR